MILLYGPDSALLQTSQSLREQGITIEGLRSTRTFKVPERDCTEIYLIGRNSRVESAYPDIKINIIEPGAPKRYTAEEIKDMKFFAKAKVLEGLTGVKARNALECNTLLKRCQDEGRVD